MRAAVLILLAPTLLWVGYSQPLWHVLGLALVMGAGAWVVGRVRAGIERRRISHKAQS